MFRSDCDGTFTLLMKRHSLCCAVERNKTTIADVDDVQECRWSAAPPPWSKQKYPNYQCSAGSSFLWNQWIFSCSPAMLCFSKWFSAKSTCHLHNCSTCKIKLQYTKQSRCYGLGWWLNPSSKIKMKKKNRTIRPEILSKGNTFPSYYHKLVDV